MLTNQPARLWPRRFPVRARQATVALEFALVAPLMILLFFAVYDISEAMIVYEEVLNASRQIASSMTNASVQIDSSTKLYYSQVELEASSIFADMPDLRSGFHKGLQSVTISSVDFEQVVTNPVCTPGLNCKYLPYVIWSVAYSGPAANPALTYQNILRSCATETTPGTLNPASALHQTTATGGASSDLTSLRTSALTTNNAYPAPPDPIIVVDVHYRYTPLFNTFLKTPLDFWSNGYWPLRSVQATQLNPATGTFTPVATDQQYSGLVSIGTLNANNQISGPYTITAGTVYPAGWTAAGAAPSAATYCISPHYLEPQT